VGTKVTNLNCIHEGIESRLNLGNTFYHSDQCLFSLSVSCLKNLKIITLQLIILRVVLYGCETCLTLREDRRV
jgi:hypothetical protein